MITPEFNRMLRLRDLDREELQELVQGLGEKPFHGKQLFAALYKRGVRSIDETTDLPLRLRQQLKAFEPLELAQVVKRQHAPDGTQKALLQLRDGECLETVWMPERDYIVQCLSTQVGCPLACTFCATGQMGFSRNLTSGEIIEQVLFFRRETSQTPRNLVFMGMGEPLLNYENLIKAIRILSAADGLGISQRRMTISTAGIIPAIRALSQEGLKIKLAISLNAPTDSLRNQLMPINRKYPINDLIQAAIEFQRALGNRITFEYALIPGLNDTPEMIQSLRKWLLKVPCKLNLIPVNPIKHKLKYSANWDEIFDRFYSTFAKDPITLTLRRSRGAEIQAACGQLAVDSPRKGLRE